LAQFVSPDDQHDVLETCGELKLKLNTQKRIVCHGHSQKISHHFRNVWFSEAVRQIVQNVQKQY